MKKPIEKEFKVDQFPFNVDTHKYINALNKHINHLEYQLEKERMKKFTRKDMIEFGYKCSPTLASPDSALKQVKLIFENYYS